MVCSWWFVVGLQGAEMALEQRGNDTETRDDVRWLYLGCRCVTCGLTACYGDWKNEYPGYGDS